MLQFFLLSLLLIISFLTKWGAYHLGGYIAVYQGVKTIKSLKVTILELFYLFFASIITIMPLGTFLSALMIIILPYVMAKTVAQTYETGIFKGFFIFLLAAIIQLVVYLPYYIYF